MKSLPITLQYRLYMVQLDSILYGCDGFLLHHATYSTYCQWGLQIKAVQNSCDVMSVQTDLVHLIFFGPGREGSCPSRDADFCHAKHFLELFQ